MSFSIESMAKMRNDILKELAPGEEIPMTELKVRMEKRIDFDAELYADALWSLLLHRDLHLRHEGKRAIICSF